jgi:hypothetical protein
MNADISNLELDRERYNKAQEIITLMNDLLRTENRQDPVHATIRRDLLDAKDHLRRVLWTYNIMIKGHDKEIDRSI